MDLESESSLLESVDDNGMIQQSQINVSDNGSFSDESVKLISNSPARTNKIEKSVEFDKPVSKGQGLRKWRRIKRDLVKETSGNMENSKVLKRGLSGVFHSHGKQMQLQSPEPEDSQGSVGSVNMLRNVGDDIEILRSGFMAGIGFTAGVDSDDGRSSKSSTAARVSKAIRFEKGMVSSGRGEKSRVETSKKHRGESVETEKENSHSSLESDSRKESGGRRMYYNGGNDDEVDRNGEASKRKDDVGEGEESVNEKSRFSEENDPLSEAISGFLTLQEALVKEVQQFREIGKETTPQHDEITSEVSSPRGEIATLLNNIEQLKIKLEETNSILKLKESHIHELESITNQNKHSSEETGNVHRETVHEDIFRQKMEAEIEHMIYSRSINNLTNQMKLVEEQEEALAEEEAHEMVNKIGEVESNAADLANRAEELENEYREINGSIKKRVWKITSWFVIQLVLLVTVVLFLLSQFLPEVEIVVPT